MTSRRRARRPGCRHRRRLCSPVNELTAAGQKKAIELNVAGLSPEDVPRRPHSAYLTIGISATTVFAELQNANPEAAVEIEGELGRDAGGDSDLIV